MLEMALVLASTTPVYEDLATKFFEHFADIADAMGDNGLWDEADGFFYDRWCAATARGRRCGCSPWSA